MIAYVVLIAWLPVILVMFQILPTRNAVVAAYLFSWLFLPVATIALPGLPDLTKVSITNVSVLLGFALREPERLWTLRFRWFDLPALVWCLCPLASFFANGFGLYEAQAVCLNQTMTWGLPYLIGRLALGDSEGVDLLARGIVLGGLVYIPLCLWEIRMGPRLHSQVYGFVPSNAWQTVKRYGGFRPLVFMQTGLEVGTWMISASLLGVWLWSSGRLRHLGAWPFGPILLVLLITTILCKSTGALALLMVGLAILGCIRFSPRLATALVLLLLAIPPLYTATRAAGLWSGEILVKISETFTNDDRAGSLQFRMINEDALAARALERPLLGWAGWGRNRVYSEILHKDAITDGYWIIALGLNGIIGLSSMMLILLLPGLILWWRHPVRTWGAPPVDTAAVLAILLGLYMVDNLSNAMFNPIYVLAAGALTALKVFEGPRPWTDEVAAAAEVYRAAILDCIQPVTVARQRRAAALESLDAAGHGLARAMQEAEESSETAEAGALLLGLIRIDVELAAALRAAGLEAEAGAHYLRAVGRGERFLTRALGRGTGPALTRSRSADGPSGAFWDPTQPEIVASCWARAIDVWEQIERLDPGSREIRAYRADACNDLAWLLALDPAMPSHDPGRARELATTAVTLTPGNAGHWNTLALAHARTRDWNATIAALDHATRLGSRPSPFDFYILAIARAHLGARAGARAAIDQADSLLPRDRRSGADLQILRAEATASLEDPRKALIDQN